MSDEVLPRDVKILYLILASMGVNAYQDQVPLQLLDFAHRYTTQVFQDALVYADYAGQSTGNQPAGMGFQTAPMSVEDVKLAVSARVAHQFKPTTPKDLIMSLAAERNKRPLPPVPSTYGLRLPPEKHCLTGQDRDVDEDDDIVIAGYEKVSAGGADDGEGNDGDEDDAKEEDAEVADAEQKNEDVEMS